MSGHRIPPHDLAAEHAVLGACLMDQETHAVATATAQLVREDFYTEHHRAIWAAIVTLAESGQGVDEITVAAVLEARQELAAVGVATFAQLIEAGAVAYHVPSYCAILRTLSAKRAQIRAIAEALPKAYNGGDPAALALELGETLQKIADRAQAFTGGLLGPQPIADVLAAVDASLDHEETDLVRTPIPELNERLGGGTLPGELILLGGRPGVAKTALVLQWAALAAEQQARTLMISREMKNAALGRRLLSQQANVVATALRQRQVDVEERTRIRRALPRLGRLPLWFDDTAATIGQIRRSVRLVKPRLVIVDYLQLVRSPADAKVARRLEVTAVSAALKTLAMSGCTVIALSSLRRLTPDGKGGRQEPTVEDLKESGDLEADADVVLLLYQKKPGDRDRRLKFAKLREGESGGEVILDWTPQYVRFTEVPTVAIPEPGADDDVPF